MALEVYDLVDQESYLFRSRSTGCDHVCGLSNCTSKIRSGSKWICSLTNITLGQVETDNIGAKAMKRAQKKTGVKTDLCWERVCETTLKMIFKDKLTKDQLDFYADKIILIHDWSGRVKDHFSAFVCACLLGFAQGVKTEALEIVEDDTIRKHMPPMNVLRSLNIQQRFIRHYLKMLKSRRVNYLQV